MKVFDSEKTDRGTFRKKVYVKGSEFQKAAMLQARKDISAERNSAPKEPEIKPYREKQYSNALHQSVWVRQEREKLKHLPNE